MGNKIRIGRNPDGRLTVSFSYNPDYIPKVKIVEGYRWHHEEKFWSFPYSRDILERIQSLFDGEGMGVDTSLQYPNPRYIEISSI